MAVEIERKFLLKSEDWRHYVSNCTTIRQGYLSRDAQSSVRIRITDERADINVKSTRDGVYRLEYEYSIPIVDAEEMLQQVAHRPLIEKIRHIVEVGKHHWEIDEFLGDNAGLIVAEVELGDVNEVFERPAWIGEEVSADARYYNSNLSKLPYNVWKDTA